MIVLIVCLLSLKLLLSIDQSSYFRPSVQMSHAMGLSCVEYIFYQTSYIFSFKIES